MSARPLSFRSIPTVALGGGNLCTGICTACRRDPGGAAACLDPKALEATSWGLQPWDCWQPPLLSAWGQDGHALAVAPSTSLPRSVVIAPGLLGLECGAASAGDGDGVQASEERSSREGAQGEGSQAEGAQGEGAHGEGAPGDPVNSFTLWRSSRRLLRVSSARCRFSASSRRLASDSA